LPPPPEGKSGWPWTEEGPRLADNPALPRVSIVTPSYNQVEFIEETIRSVLLQGYPDLEYIIMDGGSTDGSVNIIRKYEPWLTYWVTERDHGQTEAINRGWEHATGHILAYINSDDCYLGGALAYAVDGFRANPQIGMAYGTAIVVDETGKELRIWNARKFDLQTMLTDGSIVPQPATFFSKHALQSVGYLDEKWQMIMDYELCVRVGLHFQTLCIQRSIARFRDHLQSKTHRSFDAMAFELISWMEGFYPEQIPQNHLRSMKKEMFARIYYEWALNDLIHERKYPLKAIEHLLRSILQSSRFAFKRPINIAYIMKETLTIYLLRFLNRLTLRNATRHFLD